jgi:glycosyltransferase involved in cell wall biosynthesis
MSTVSVVIPLYNSAATLGRAVESVLAQTVPAHEIICVDDGSRDDPAAALARFGAHVRLLRQPNQGPSAARNVGLAIASGDCVAFLDADDFWMPAMLERCAGALDRERRCVLAYCDARIVDEHGATRSASMVDAARAHAPTMDEMLAQIWPIVPSTAVMRVIDARACGGFSIALRSCEDIHFWLLMRERGEFSYVSETLAAKTEYEVYPKVLERDPGAREFARLVTERYGARGRGLLRAFVRFKSRILDRTAAEAIRAGAMRDARRCYLRAIAYEPARLKLYLRLARTLLP